MWANKHEDGKRPACQLTRSEPQTTVRDKVSTEAAATTTTMTKLARNKKIWAI